MHTQDMRRRVFFSFFLLIPMLQPVSAQLRDRSSADIHMLQDSLANLGYTMYNAASEPDRLDANFSFVRTLVAALKIPHSYDFAFDSLKMVSILSPPDDRFRIFSWHLPLDDGSFLYYGTIQMKTADGSLKLFPLLDKTYEIENPEEAITTGNDWYGAQYYRIIPFAGDYILLGWKGHTPRLTQKVVEVLRIGGNSATFGKQVFRSDSTAQHTRLIYRFSRQASMYLEYDRDENRIVLDHLAPLDEQHEGQYENYGPDMTHDAWKLQNGMLVLVEDIVLHNLPSIHDDMFNDPTKPSTHPKSGFPQQ